MAADTVEVTGIVLSSMPVGEADRRLLLLTKELGKISVFARGARKPTSTLVGCTRPFAFGKFYIYPGRSAYSLHKAEIRDYFEPIVMDITKSSIGCYFLELSGIFAREGADEGPLLGLIYYSLRAILNERLPNRLVQRIFEIKLLMLNGVVPDLTVCGRCGKKLSEGFFRPGIMQMICTDCAGADRSGAALSGGSLYALSFIRSAEVNRLYTFTLKEELVSELSELSEILLRRSLDRPVSSREMLELFIGNQQNT